MELVSLLKIALRDVTLFSQHLSGVRLRSYQRAAARAVVDSVVKRQGLSIVVILPRQSGKNELQAQIEAYLLALLHDRDAEIVKVCPTWKPQSQNAMRRLERVLKANTLTRGRWVKEQGYIYRVGAARIYFLSGEPTASIVGATASTLLEVDEAQDILADKFDREILPMAASTNATRVFWGTAWTSQTLLAREKRAALAAQAADGQRRVFEMSADEVRREAPAYGRFVDAQVARLGRNHPSIRTQFFSEEIDGQSGLFTVERLALARGSHPPQAVPAPGAIYAFCIDVGGEAGRGAPPGAGWEGAEARAAGAEHDMTALTVFEVDLATLLDPGLQAPTYKVVHRRAWSGVGQPALYGQLNALANLWSPHRIVIDATGLGEGLAAFLERSHPGRVLRFKFSQASKSTLGWAFINILESGRYKEPACDAEPRTTNAELVAAGPGAADPGAAELQALFFAQAAACTLEILPGPGRILRYAVPDSARRPAGGQPLHDDLLLSAMLCAALESTGTAETWGAAESTVIRPIDPFQELMF